MINELRDEMKKFISDVNQNIKNPEDLHYILVRTEKLFDEIIKQVEDIVKYKQKEINAIQKKQDEQDDKMEQIEEKMKQMSMDIYEEEFGEFEITCPYCNCRFIADIDETNKEINCPECNNTIELDWDGE